MKFGRFDIDLEMRCLRLDGQSVRVGSRAFDVLATIVSAGGSLVTRNELMDEVWPSLVVEDGNIDVQISTLRKVLGSDRQLIATVAGRGFRLAQRSSTPADFAAPPAPTTSPSGAFAAIDSITESSLPARRAEPVGRAAALDQLRDQLSRAAVLTLTGIGGVGKTSLATEAAYRYADELGETVSFVDLSMSNSRDAVLRSIAETCALPFQSTELTVESLTRALSDTPRLLVLDSAEHVVGSVAEIVELLVKHSGSIRVLVTSREPLRIPSERVMKVAPLDTPAGDATDAAIRQSPAVELFLQRVTSLPGHVGVEVDQIQVIGEICRRMDGIPLAIELAAACVETLGLEGVRRRLDDRLIILTGGYRTTMPRHRNLRATLDASFALLSDTARCLLQCVSIYERPFTFEWMCTAASDAGLSEEAVFDGIGELVAKSLVNVDFEKSEAMYQLFESTRVYARNTLRDRTASAGNAVRYGWNAIKTEVRQGWARPISAYAARNRMAAA